MLNDLEFEHLQDLITHYMERLEPLQQIHIVETGKRFVLGQPIYQGESNKDPENRRQ